MEVWIITTQIIICFFKPIMLISLCVFICSAKLFAHYIPRLMTKKKPKKHIAWIFARRATKRDMQRPISVVKDTVVSNYNLHPRKPSPPCQASRKMVPPWFISKKIACKAPAVVKQTFTTSGCV
jgi:hypothetical protein